MLGERPYARLFQCLCYVQRFCAVTTVYYALFTMMYLHQISLITATTYVLRNAMHRLPRSNSDLARYVPATGNEILEGLAEHSSAPESQHELDGMLCMQTRTTALTLACCFSFSAVVVIQLKSTDFSSQKSSFNDAPLPVRDACHRSAAVVVSIYLVEHS
jgi:hypothetical protein